MGKNCNHRFLLCRECQIQNMVKMKIAQMVKKVRSHLVIVDSCTFLVLLQICQLSVNTVTHLRS